MAIEHLLKKKKKHVIGHKINSVDKEILLSIL